MVHSKEILSEIFSQILLVFFKLIFGVYVRKITKYP